MAEQDLDRTEAATPWKLQKSREKGQVWKSPDLVSVIVFTVAMVFMTWQGWSTWREQFRLDHALLVQAGRLDATPEALWGLTSQTLRSSLVMAGPFFLTLLVAALAANLLQTGPVLSAEPIKPDWSRLSPARGLKNLFSLRTLFHAGRSVLKLLVLTWIVYLALKSLIPHFYTLAELQPLAEIQALFRDMAGLGLRIAAILWLIAILDVIYSRREFAKQMRMSRRELKDEIKHREGDPAIRARMREMRRDLLKRVLALRKTREADVVITNPTHLAVALRYVHGQMVSPQLVAKGAGLLAATMRAIAARHGIPVVQNPALARSLFRGLRLEQHVPPDLYAEVARIIVWVFAMRDARSRGGTAGLEQREVAWTS
jgi:flagellar biosynthetic protein FlhB